MRISVGLMCFAINFRITSALTIVASAFETLDVMSFSGILVSSFTLFMAILLFKLTVYVIGFFNRSVHGFQSTRFHADINVSFVAFLIHADTNKKGYETHVNICMKASAL